MPERCCSHDERAVDEALRCGRCLRVLPSTTTAAGACAKPGCAEVLCSTCWAQEDTHLCDRHRPTRAQRLADARRAAARTGQPQPVTARQARHLALHYLTRVELAFKQRESFLDPTCGKVVHPGDFGETVWQHHPAELVAPWDDDSEFHPATPDVSRLVIPVGGAWTIEARIACRVTPYALNGFDQDPLSAEDLTGLLAAALHQTHSEGRARILALASPTGWDSAAIASITGSGVGDAFLHRDLLPFIVDLRSPRVWHNPNDARAAGLPERLGALTTAEAAEAAALWLRDACRRHGSVSLSLATAETGTSEAILLQAMHQLASAGAHVALDVPGIGYSLSRR